MNKNIIIYGKSSWPFTKAAREAFDAEGKEYDYFDVSLDTEKLDAMMSLTDGKRRVPVIVENGKIIFGFQGKT